MITRIKTKKIIQSIVYCLFSTAVYCLLYIAHWAKFGQQVDVMSLEITWYQMTSHDAQWHYMVPCYITSPWYPVTSHVDDTLLHYTMMIPCLITWCPQTSYSMSRKWEVVAAPADCPTAKVPRIQDSGNVLDVGNCSRQPLVLIPRDAG